jgi:branched-chain amino acid transport system substrate-binding protein
VKRIWRYLAMVTMVLLFSSVVLGCSNASGGESKEITIGYVGGLSGDTASFGLPAYQALKYTVNEINKSGGIKGKKIKITKIDDKGNPFEGQKAIDKFASKGIHFVLSASSSAAALSEVPKVKSDKILAVSPTATDPAVNSKDPYFFTILTNNNQMGESAAYYGVKKEGYKEFISFVRDDAMGKSINKAFKKKVNEMGSKVVEEYVYSADTQDFNSYLNEGINKHPNAAIMLTGYAPDSGSIAKQARASGFDNMFFGASPLDNTQYLEVAGDAGNKTAFTAPYYPESGSKETKKFIEEWTSKKDKQPNIYQAHTYDAVYLLKKAIENADSFDVDKVRKELLKIKDYKGVTGTISINDNGSVTKPIFMMEWQNKKPVFKQKLDPSDYAGEGK